MVVAALKLAVALALVVVIGDALGGWSVVPFALGVLLWIARWRG